MASNQSFPNDAWTWAALEPEPTDNERALFERFAYEYLVDRDPARAASRCGFQAAFALEYGRQLLTRSYVQRRLAELERTPVDPKGEREVDAMMTKARLRAIRDDAGQKASARVAASRELNAMHGLHAPTKIDLKAQHKGGVMMLPVMSMEEWEAAAQASQSKLIEDSKVE